MFKLTVDPLDAPAKPRVVTIGFERGRAGDASTAGASGRSRWWRRSTRSRAPTASAGSTSSRTAWSGIKSRGVYETPAGTVLHIAHRELERLVLDRDTLHFKQSVSVRYAQLIYDGLWFSTLREALAAFVDETEQEVTGEVRVRLYKGAAEAVGRRSPRSLYRQDLATFGEGMAYDHADAAGFIRLFGLPERVRALTRDRVPVDVKAVEVTRPVQRRLRPRASGGAVSVTAPLGFRAAGVAAGIKPERLDLALRGGRPACAAAGVFTTNLAQAAPVLVSREHLASGRARAVVVNAGCANAGTGDAGLADAREMAALAARAARLPCRGGGGGVDRRDRRAAADGEAARRASPTRGRGSRATAAPTRRARS